MKHKRHKTTAQRMTVWFCLLLFIMAFPVPNGYGAVAKRSADLLDHNKYIDYLGDGNDNPDTSIDNGNEDISDLYRVYLDVTGKVVKNKPIDLLVVVDRSGSMDKTDMGYGEARDSAVTKMLNGSEWQSTQNGFISQFLSLNDGNRIAVTTFEGRSADRRYRSFDYHTDAEVLLPWTHSPRFVDAANVYNNGTHYEAGLRLAADEFSAVKGNGHRKMMIFISDGVPTFYLDEWDNRRGNGQYSDPYNVSVCKQPSKDAFDEFVRKHPDVTVHTIGVSSDINGTSLNESQSPEVLRYMAQNGGGVFIGVRDTEQLIRSMMDLLKPFKVKELRVTDRISPFVRYCEKRPDVKVTQKHRVTGETKTLWEHGHDTPQNQHNGHRIVHSVTYHDSVSGDQSSTGTVDLEFDSREEVDDTYLYTLSYNVEVTDRAYDNFATNGYDTTGDIGTDYPGNVTSSGKNGFHANKEAFIRYKLKGNDRQEYYAHPVVQVGSARMKLKKSDQEGKNLLSGAIFSLYRPSIQGTPGAVKIPGATDVWGVLQKQDITVDKVADLSLPLGEYYLVETKAPEGYMALSSPIRFNMKRRQVEILSGQDWTIVQNAGGAVSEATLTVKNNPLYKLPNTGGVGVYPFVIIGSMLVSLAVILMRKRSIVQR